MQLSYYFVLYFVVLLASAAKHRKSNEVLAEKEHPISEETNGLNFNANTIAFSVARNKSMKGHKQIQASLGFDHVIFNSGSHFDPDKGVFTVPVDGVYEFTFSGSALPHKKLSLQLMKNHFEVQTLAYDGHRKRHQHVENQKVLLQLLKGDRIWIRLAASKEYGVVGSLRNAYVTTFTGHLLRHVSRDEQATGLDGISLIPVESSTKTISRRRAKRLAKIRQQAFGETPPAFSVAKTTSVIGKNTNYSKGRMSYDGILTYDKVFVNVGEVIDVETGEFTAPIDGLYYFSYTVGKYPKKKLSVSLMKNSNEFQVMVYDESRTNRREMQSQSVILPLVAHDRIWLKSYNAAGYAVYSNYGNYITFNGYLLQAS